ncbi:MAG TPA: ABC transporter ATP-binding protein [Ignavibacteria bacterium]|mgnify:CR=1 FL=1|nr:ABC transporter ATP-binding protein [Ignavibacteria bacterium]HMQ98262.1 ABC transporter ATP-binding protein [Ignavibacteria bacterium]
MDPSLHSGLKNSIEVKDLTKKYGKFTSVDSISFEVEQGEVFGFLGANGAGKSTTIKMLCAILEPTSGDAMVAGYSIEKEPDMVKRNIGYMSQKFSLYTDLTVEENINFFASVYGLKGTALDDRKKWVLNTAGLTDRKDSLTGTLSTGFKQRLALGCAVIHEPKIVFLDEPTGGVDPISRKNFWDLINDLSTNGTTVFVTTHYLDEAEFCNRIMMIDAGKIIAGGSPGELKTKYLSNPIFEAETGNADAAIKILDNIPWIKSSAYFGEYIHITLNKDELNNADTRKNEIIEILGKNNIGVNRIERIAPSLEDVFVNLLEKDK